jgi:hypothetical protein
MLGFDLPTLASGVLQFVALPAVIERVGRLFFERTHAKLAAADRAVLSQRLGRAVMALNLVQGAARTMIQPVHRDLTIWSRSPLGQYYMLGTVLFYSFDTLLLAAQRAKTLDLWVHHLIAVGSFSYYLYRGVSEMGAMCVLLSELLVPWGFLLFYFKLTRLQANPFFKTIVYGGVATLLFRMSLWSWLTYRIVVHEAHHCPPFLYYFSLAFVPVILSLDTYWIRLYLSNFGQHRKALAALNGAPVPSIFSPWTTSK